MTVKEISFFDNNPIAYADGDLVTLFPLDRAILIYLVFHRLEAITYEDLERVFAPKFNNKDERDKFKQDLYRSRNRLKPILMPDEKNLQLDSNVQVDVHMFNEQVAQIPYIYHGDDLYIQTLEAIDRLYNYGLLRSYDFQTEVSFQPISREFQSVLDREDRELSRKIDYIRELMMIFYLDAHLYEQAIHHANQWIIYDDENESAHLWLVKAYYLNKDIRTALAYGRQLHDKLIEDDIYQAFLEELDDVLQTIQDNKSLKDLFTYIKTPLNFVGRDSDLTEIKQRLNSSRNDMRQAQRITVIRGWPGVGKTALMDVIATAPDVRLDYRDGVLKAELGPNGDAQQKLTEWCKQLGLPSGNNFTTLLDTLKKHFLDRQCILLVDDVFQINQINPFQEVAGVDCRLLITTRLTEIADQYKKETYHLEPLSPEDSVHLMTLLVPTVSNRYPDLVHKVVEAIGYLPLAIHVAARLIQDKMDELDKGFINQEEFDIYFDDLNDILLQEPDPQRRYNPETGMTATVSWILQRSIDELGEDKSAFAKLGFVVAKPADISLKHLQKLWNVDDPKPIIRKLVNKGLLERSAHNRYQIHALLKAQAQQMFLGRS